MSETTHKQFQTIVNNAQSISRAELVVLCILNETTNEFEYKAIDQVNTAEIHRVMDDAIKSMPSFKLLNYSFPKDINASIKKIVNSKTHLITNLQSAIENIVPKIVSITAYKNLGINSTAILPITVEDKVIGLMGYFFVKTPLEADITILQAFTNQVMLLFENFKVSEILYEKLKEETIKLEEERNNLDSKVKERTLKLDNSRSALLFMLKDIDKASKELAAAKEYTDNIIKSMIDALIVVDTNAIIQKVNQSTLILLGYEEHELIGKPFKLVFEDDDTLFKGSNVEELFKKVCVTNVEKTYVTKNGGKIAVLFSGSVMYDENSNVSGIVCVALSNTKRKIAEKALKDSEQRMKHLLSSNPAVIYTSQAILPFKWTYISDNIESLTGYTPKELIYTPYFRENHIHPEEQERFFKELPLLFKNGHYIQEYRFLCKNGSYLWLLDEIKLIEVNT